MTKKHNETDVLYSLSKKNDIKIIGKEIQILSNKVFNRIKKTFEENPKKKYDLGNKSLGKIDYLINYRGYYKRSVNSFNTF